MLPGKRAIGDVLANSKALLIGGSLQDPSVLAGKEFVVVQELYETETTAYADVILPAASFAEVDGTYTNNTGFVQRVRKAIDPQHQSKPDWTITTLIAREMGVDFGYDFSASAVFRAIADNFPAYAGLRYPALKDESNPVQVKHAISGGKDLSAEIDVLRTRVGAMSNAGEKIIDVPKVGHKLHRLTTMTSKTAQFHLLAHGNPKPENLLVAPLEQFELDGTPKVQELAEFAAVGITDRTNPGGR
jgi:anaerobic selenocysteine-containing dehydrogenase